MSRYSAIIKFGYSLHKEYDDEKAGNKNILRKASFAQHRQQSLIVHGPSSFFGLWSFYCIAIGRLFKEKP